MTIDVGLSREMRGMVDASTGLVSRAIFSDERIFQLEMERIFARAWNFVAHDSQIPNPGDFFLTFIGEDRVIVVRDNDGNAQVLVNSCRHRGNAVCRAEEGHASSFMCTYHGWTFDLQGKLVGVPGFKEVYHEELDRENWGLIKAAHVDSYKGFIFATMDPEAIGLYEYLGQVGRIGIDLLAERGDIKMVPGVQKYVIDCNWKFAADNVWDWYHVPFSHFSATASGYNRRGNTPEPKPLAQAHMVMLGEYGHVVGGPRMTEELKNRLSGNPAFDDSWRERPEAQAALGPIGIQSRGHPHIFPNMWFTGGNQVSLRIPKSPTTTEIWWFTFLDKNRPQEVYKAQRHNANHTFGPAGMLEQDDGENWGQSTRAMRGVISRQYPLNYSMDKRHGEVIEDELGPPRIFTQVNEHGQLWLYQAWADWMAAESWDDLKRNHTEVPGGTI
ncbi:MAG: SRPBCC family protein [Dehalococcoidia bacterium]